ncbi:MAG: DEAD/DEAH box helicase family protein [Chromatiales bacterium]|nr:DEAD/DEAH box helicase family protein [Chromatiales bacterium]
MQLKEYQELVLDKLGDYLKILKQEYSEEKETVEFHRSRERNKEIAEYCGEAWEKFNEAENPSKYIEKKDGLGNPIPNICIKVPTGGGKTLLGVCAVERINADYFLRNTGLVLWIVPSEAIYTQTVKNFKDKAHPYRQFFERAAAGRVKILQKTDAFTQQDIQAYLCVMVIMLQSANRETRESLRVFKDSGNFIGFFPQPDEHEANARLLAHTTNLDCYENKDNEAKLGGGRQRMVKHSLGNAVRLSRPLVILDEGHRAYSQLARKTLSDLNPRFILELSATPNTEKLMSNVLVSIPGLKLKEEEMIKLPINVINSKRVDWKKTLSDAYKQLTALDQDCRQYYQNSKRYIRPIMLIQVERTGKEQRDGNHLHTEDVKEYLMQLGVLEDAIKVKTAQKNELKDESLLSDTSQVKFIITKQALQEGWDCPFAYVLTILSNAQSRMALTQLIGRILRQPYAQRTPIDSLNESYVYCCNPAVKDIVDGIKKGLQREGMDDLTDNISVRGDSELILQAVPRRRGFKKTKILLPKVLHINKNKKPWRDICYESDILQHVDFSKMSYRKKDTLTVDDIDKLQVDYITADFARDNGKFGISSATATKTAPITMDFAYMVQRLSDTVPNPWQAARILEEVITAMQARGISAKQIDLNRGALLDAIETDIKDQTEKASEKIFRNKLERGDICFNIFKDSVHDNWGMPTEIEYHVSDDDKVLNRENNTPLQLSLFERTYERHYNAFEKKVAWYMDKQQAIKWWHRMVAKQEYYLQGWQKRKVYPDFLAFVDTNGSGRVSIIETKGDHLKGNDDTKYKEDLFELLKNSANNTMHVGKLETASAGETRIVFDILMEKNWQTELNDILRTTSD